MSRADVEATVQACFGLTFADLVDHRRRLEDHVDARAVAAWLLCKRAGYTPSRAMSLLGYSEATRYNAWDRLCQRVTSTPRLRAQVAQ